MPISDGLPERRNLVIAATSIIAFYAAGGWFPEPTIRLLVASISFQHPENLVYFVWGLLIWFQLRFWQVTKSDLKNRLVGEISQWRVPESFKNDAVRKITQRNNKMTVVNVRIQDIDKGKVRLACDVTLDDGKEDDTRPEYVTLSKPPGGWQWLRWGIRSLFVGNAVAEYIVPYILFVGALSAPFWCRWLGTCCESEKYLLALRICALVV